MIRHVIFCSFREGVTLGHIQVVEKAFLQIPVQIEGVLSVEWGVNNSPESKNAGFTHCILMTFQDEAVRRHYLDHPAHCTLKSIFNTIRHKIIVLDYSLTAGIPIEHTL